MTADGQHGRRQGERGHHCREDAERGGNAQALESRVAGVKLRQATALATVRPEPRTTCAVPRYMV